MPIISNVSEEDYIELSKVEENNSEEELSLQPGSVKYNSETEAAMQEAIQLSNDPNTQKYATFADAVGNMMPEDELHEKLQEGFNDLEAGRTRPAKEAFEEFRRQLEESLL